MISKTILDQIQAARGLEKLGPWLRREGLKPAAVAVFQRELERDPTDEELFELQKIFDEQRESQWRDSVDDYLKEVDQPHNRIAKQPPPIGAGTPHTVSEESSAGQEDRIRAWEEGV